MSGTSVRCVTLPVAVPLGTDPAGRPWTWESFDAALAGAFRLGTDLANWCVLELYRREPHPFPQDGRFPPLPAFGTGGLYRHAFGNLADKQEPRYPGTPGFRATVGSMPSANCIVRAVEGKYRQARFDVLRRGRQDLLRFRYPFPFPVHQADWEPGYAPGGFPTVALVVPGAGRVELRLKRRADFGRQLGMFKLLHDGLAKRGEAALYRTRKGELMLKLVGHFPRGDRTGAPNVCFLHTDPHALLVAEVNGRAVTVTNGDHFRQAHAVITTAQERHRRFLQRAAEDKKREVRMDRAHRANFNKKVTARCAKQRARIDTAVKQVAAQTARFLERQRVGLVVYDDSVQTFLPDGFAWHQLKTRLEQVFVGTMGGDWISGTYVHLTTDQEKTEWLATVRAGAALTAVKKVSAHKSRRPSKSHPAVSAPPATSAASGAPSSTRPSRARSKPKSSTPPAAGPT